MSRSGCSPARTASDGGGILESCRALFRDRSGVGHHARDAEIGQQRFAVGREEHVAGGHITVGEALAVKVCQGLRDGSQDRHRFAGTQTSPASHERRQRAAGRVVQRKPEAAAARVVNRQAHHGVHAKQVAVCQGGEDPDFAPHDVLRPRILPVRRGRHRSISGRTRGPLTVRSPARPWRCRRAPAAVRRRNREPRGPHRRPAGDLPYPRNSRLRGIVQKLSTGMRA